MKLLLIGDERKNRRIFAWGFSTDSFHVRTASSRADVDSCIEAEPFHAACIDWRMRSADAVEIAGLLHERLPELPIVALVSDDSREASRTVKSFGVTAQLVTPFSVEDLHAGIRRHALGEPVMARR